jgi:NhaP-type Na+/H+ or K+/H+ antiporter
METLGLVAVLLCILAAAAISRRIQGTILTLPMLYAAFGLLLGGRGLGLIHANVESEGIRLIAELTLVMVLASDASRINLRELVRDHTLPQHLLGFSLPLTMVLGTAVAAVLFGVLSFWEAAILAVVLTPTDASLGQAVVSNPRVPVRIRQTLNFTVLDAEAVPGVDLICDVAMITVLFSIYAHGVTAAPGAKWYGRRMAEIDEERRDVREMSEVPELPLRVEAKP